MVFPLPVGLPLSVYDNVALAPRLAGVRSRDELDAVVERIEPVADVFTPIFFLFGLLIYRIVRPKETIAEVKRA